MKITPKAFIKQWSDAAHKFEINLFNFKSAIGPAVVEQFHNNFKRESWNGTPWPKRKDNQPHALLYHYGHLYRSIVVKRLHQKNPKKVTIHTCPEEFDGISSTDPHKWGQRRSKRAYGFIHAGIHNEGGRVATPGSLASYIPQRKFIGTDSPAVDRVIWLYTDKYLFKRFPK